MDMLTILAQKLQTQTLDDDQPFPKKIDDDRDSGTESDEENAELEEIEKQMENCVHKSGTTIVRPGSTSSNLVSEGCSPHLQPTDLSDSDQDLEKDTSDFERQSSDFERHSSEEELTTINSKELHKRKWSQANRRYSGRSSGSSDDEVRDLLANPQPLIFSSSPPKGIQRIRKAPPEKFFLTSMSPLEVCAVSPRKRHRFASTRSHTGVQRPCLDFEKMQKALREEAAHYFKIEELICKRLKIED